MAATATPNNAIISDPQDYTLKETTTFSRTEGDGTIRTLDLPKGKKVTHRRKTTDTEIIDQVSYIDADGRKWISRKRRPIDPPAPTAAGAVAAAFAAKTDPPVSAHTQAVAAATAATAKHAVDTLAARGGVTLVTADDAEAKAQEIKVRRLAKIAEMLSGEVYQVNYYIPSDCDIANPSPIFRRHGFRLDGSNWVFPQKGLESKEVQRVFKCWDSLTTKQVPGSVPGTMSAKRVRYWAIKYTKEQLAEMRDLAMSQLADELQKTHASLIQRIENAAKTLDEAMAAATTAGDRHKAEAVHNGSLRGTIREASERFEMCLKGAEIFDDTGSLDALFAAVADAIQAQAKGANATLRARQVKQVAVPDAVKAATGLANRGVGAGPAPR